MNPQFSKLFEQTSNAKRSGIYRLETNHFGLTCWSFCLVDGKVSSLRDAIFLFITYWRGEKRFVSTGPNGFHSQPAKTTCQSEQVRFWGTVTLDNEIGGNSAKHPASYQESLSPYQLVIYEQFPMCRALPHEIPPRKYGRKIPKSLIWQY